MRKHGFEYLAVGGVLLLLSIIVFFCGPGLGAFAVQKTFEAELHNSLYHLDLAKWQWAEEKHKPEAVVPAMTDLTPYLGDWTNRIEQFVALGINYKIAPVSEAESQSDVATLTRDLTFPEGISRIYTAGTSYCIRKGWAHPQSSTTGSFRTCFINNHYLFAAALFLLGMGNLVLYAIKKHQNPKLADGN